MKENSLGEFEEIVMLTVAVLYENAYGISIKSEIESRLKRGVSVGAMRTALSRLEKIILSYHTLSEPGPHPRRLSAPRVPLP